MATATCKVRSNGTRPQIVYQLVVGVTYSRAIPKTPGECPLDMVDCTVFGEYPSAEEAIEQADTINRAAMVAGDANGAWAHVRAKLA